MTRSLGAGALVLGALAVHTACACPRPVLKLGTYEVHADEIPPELGATSMTMTVTETTVTLVYEAVDGVHEVVYDRAPIPEAYPSPGS